MKKRYKLNDNGKYAIGIILSIILIVVCTILYFDRIEKINNGELVVVNDSEMRG